VRFDLGEDLDWDGVYRALSMSQKKSKYHLEKLVDTYMQKNADIHQCPMLKISFKDYYNIILLLGYLMFFTFKDFLNSNKYEH
jgi:hypothetical protein